MSDFGNLSDLSRMTLQSDIPFGRRVSCWRRCACQQRSCLSQERGRTKIHGEEKRDLLQRTRGVKRIMIQSVAEARYTMIQ